MDQTELEISTKTETYADAILFPKFAEKYDPKCRPPVWAEFRNDLMESVEYFRAGSNHPAYRSHGVVYGFLVDKDSGERCYIDSEVVIARVGGAAGGNPKITGRTWTDPKDQVSSDVVVQAFYQTQQMGLSVVLILGSKCAASPISLVDRYSVMDHFRISYIWAEKSVRGKTFYKVRFDRVVRGKAWWTPNQPEPPPFRHPSAAVAESPCIFCNTPGPQIYAETWLCINPSCAFFWHTKDGSEAPEDLTFDRNFLKQRLPEVPWFKPGFDLVPDLMSNLLTLRETGQISAALRSLWRGIICPQCHKCNPRIYWNVWTCENCDIDFPPDPGYIDLHSIITRSTVSYVGHPMVSSEWPKNDFAYHGPIFREHYRVERWILHGNSSITLISPTASFNEERNGPNTLWEEMLASANLGNLGLRRGQLRQGGIRTRHFFNHFGADYDMSDVPSTPLDEAPLCVIQSMGLLNQVGQAELGMLYQWPNQVSVNGYWSEMGLGWHTDGDDEVGQTISTLSLGGDATMHIRLQNSFYRNEIDMMNEDPIVGALDWKNLTELRRRWQAGEIEDEEYRINPEVVARSIGRTRPQIDLPMIHGSIVIMTGTSLTKYYEHSIEVKDSIRFSVTCRTIDERVREEIMCGPRMKVLARQAGQKFILARDKVRDLKDDIGSDPSDHDDEEDDIQPAESIKNRPVRGNPVRKSGRRPARHSRTSSGNISRSASPSSNRQRNSVFVAWSAEADEKLRRLVRLLGNKWTEISKEFPDKSAAACRLHYIYTEKGDDSNEYTKLSLATKATRKAPKGKIRETEGTKSARASPRKRGRKGGESAELRAGADVNRGL